MKCASCSGVAHPATGHAWSERTLVCRACYVRFRDWMIGHTSERKRTKKGRLSSDFYGAALRKAETLDMTGREKG